MASLNACLRLPFCLVLWYPANFHRHLDGTACNTSTPCDHPFQTKHIAYTVVTQFFKWISFFIQSHKVNIYFLRGIQHCSYQKNFIRIMTVFYFHNHFCFFFFNKRTLTAFISIVLCVVPHFFFCFFLVDFFVVLPRGNSLSQRSAVPDCVVLRKKKQPNKR